MLISELALSYKETAAAIHTRIVELEAESKAETDPAKKQQLLDRAHPLRSMYRDVRTVARNLEHYYEKYVPRQAGGLPADKRRRA